MAGEYYDPSTGQIWYDDGQGNQWYVREANPWEQPGYQEPQPWNTNPYRPTEESLNYTPPPQSYPTYIPAGGDYPQNIGGPLPVGGYVVRSYPEQRADGSVWEVDEYSDGSYQDRMVSGPTGGAGGGVPGGYFGGGPAGGAVPSPSPGGAALGTAAVAAGSRGYQPGTELYQMLSQLYGPAIAERRLRELDIPQMQEAQRQFNEKLAFERAMNEFRQRQEQGQAERAQAQLTGYFGGAPTFQREQHAAQLAANPRNYAEYFAFTRPGQPIPVPAFAAQLASGQSLGRAFGGGGVLGGGAFFGLEPGQFTPRNQRMMLPAERATAESLISAQGEDPEDFYARAQQFFPFGRAPANPRYTSY